jgi:hypothetical protein
MKACARSRPSHQHHGLVGHHRQVEPWVYQRISETFVLDDAEMRAAGELNPAASRAWRTACWRRMTANYWTPDEDTLEALHGCSEELEDNGWKALRPSSRAAGNLTMSPRDEIPMLKGEDGEGIVQVHQDPSDEDRGRQGVFGLRQGRDRQIHHLLEPVGGLFQAGQARAADRLRPEARLDLHPDRAAAAHGDRHPEGGRFPPRGTAPRGLRDRRL